MNVGGRNRGECGGATRHDATASVGDHDVLLQRQRLLSRDSVRRHSGGQLMGNQGKSGRTRKHAVLETVRPVGPTRPGARIAPQCVAVSPTDQLQFDSGSIPAASRSAGPIGLLGPPGYEPRRVLTLITEGRYASSRRPACRV